MAATEKLESEIDNAQLVLNEYADFAYTVSHDLSAPLRHIKEFARLLIASRADQLNEEEREYADYLQKSLERVDKMQQGLLAFSRVNTRSQSSESINTNELIANVLCSLEGEITELNPSINHGEMPEIYGDPSQIHTVFLSIIDNAIKFHKEGSAREISIDAKSKSDKVIFTIRDNGIGMQEKFCTEVFRMFRMLHPAGKFAGHGVGLTLAKKIIERHGGEINIKSSPNEWTEVTFSLPQKP
ncbi:MAG: GHKL domain-containing protein [Alphaproteobacteria bacterium]|nr:GHKL domain-containing protein [Alphaproteobacteria bacterium]